jgi:hypothetical protein
MRLNSDRQREEESLDKVSVEGTQLATATKQRNEDD